MARRRELVAFSLSFLDVMSCGFGAVILIYIVINHSSEATSQDLNKVLMEEVSKMEEVVDDGKERMVILRNTLEETEEQTVTTDGLALQIIQTLAELRTQLAELESSSTRKDKSIEELKIELKQLEAESQELKGSVGGQESVGKAVVSFAGEGDRQYLTGMRIGGKNILILMDASASMLDEKIVNVIRMRNMSKERQLASSKWQRAIRTVEWIAANIPGASYYQLYTFNTDVQATITDSTGQWLKALDGVNLELSLDNLKQIVPEKGTSLITAFSAIQDLKPLPDNVYLIIDSLPTQSDSPPRGSTVESRERVAFFQDSLDQLPAGIPVNVILFPMEGDPLATPTYWQLAQITGGSFLSPPDDWP
jgi:hypothetical protein